jgi:ubiquinone/menaquinone biosynthesis C-methylase UbiE
MVALQAPVQVVVELLPNINTMSYLQTTKDIYKEVAEKPQLGLCCTTTPIWLLPGLSIPKRMLEMNYGCGSTVNQADLINNPKILYVGVGGGMELLQFSYFSRQDAGVTGVDVVDEMLQACRENFDEAKKQNPWFHKEFVNLLKGDALNLPIKDNSFDVAAQNCLFNIFKQDDLKKALNEMYRVLKPHGRLILSDPVCEQQMPPNLLEDDYLRGLCLSGAIPLNQYIKMIADIGFGTIEVRAKRPYRILDPSHFETQELIFIESVEICAIKDPMPPDGPCVFTGRTAIYYGTEEYLDDEKGHVLYLNQPLAICDKTARSLASLNRNDLFISNSTYFYNGGGCC